MFHVSGLRALQPGEPGQVYETHEVGPLRLLWSGLSVGGVSDDGGGEEDSQRGCWGERGR